MREGTPVQRRLVSDDERRDVDGRTHKRGGVHTDVSRSKRRVSTMCEMHYTVSNVPRSDKQSLKDDEEG